jgi:hypothetical protein
MPTTRRSAHGPTDLDYDVASLRDPLPPETLTVLDTVLDARTASEELTAHLNRAQQKLEAGTFDEAARDEIGADLLALSDQLRAAAIGIFG